jgi:hypothetical protein
MDLHRLLAIASLALAAGCAHAMGSIADVSIVDRATRQSLPAHWHEGRAYVVGRPGAEYEVRVCNRTGEEVLAVISVDGVNVVSGETADVQQGGYVLGPWQATTIRGWRKSLEETASFYFTSLGDSYAGRTRRPSNVGVIGVAVFRRAAPPRESIASDMLTSPPPSASAAPERESRAESANAQKQRALAASPSAPLGTGHGRRENSPVREVAFDRAAQPAEMVTIYYDSYRNLVAQGVLTVPVATRDPSPFPARFAPDPPR